MCVCVHAGVVTISSSVDSGTSAYVTNLFFETGSKRCTLQVDFGIEIACNRLLHLIVQSVQTVRSVSKTGNLKYF